jgi:hypothetical protein
MLAPKPGVTTSSIIPLKLRVNVPPGSPAVLARTVTGALTIGTAASAGAATAAATAALMMRNLFIKITPRLTKNVNFISHNLNKS